MQSDLSKVLYSATDLALIKRLSTEEILYVETDNHLFTDIVCRSGFTLCAMPEDYWASSLGFEQAGYAWVKRAIFQQEPFSPGWNEDGQATLRIIPPGPLERICIVRTAAGFSEAEDESSAATFGDRIERVLQQIRQTHSQRSFNTFLFNPELVEKTDEKLRHCLVDVGFLLFFDQTVVSVAAYDNFFSLEPARMKPADLDDHFISRYQMIPLRET
ncbi:hypothetical protein [Silvimonas amylolytica]|uniref:Uncharacterized protein n=1 Tax=Silvimonas amylolytica TaxID=449663 RepID=A0ABQ2PJ21_9NEIS|nr:hypothetical protein [Silvimonas amylolytica]GGP25321.1 hypothetical protein GCM10010971_11400 [Silvimonas amylolytica]